MDSLYVAWSHLFIKYISISFFQLIHGQGFNDDERADLVPFVHKNIFDAMEILIYQKTLMNIRFSDPMREEDVSVAQNEKELLEKRLSAAQ